MNQDDINQLAAQSLIEQALASTTESKAELLIRSAARLDSRRDYATIKALWVESWLVKNQDRKGANYE
jgi:hypothetical protein